MNDKRDPMAMDPALAREFLNGTLARIRTSQPDFYPFVLRALHAEDPTLQLNGFTDAIGDIGSSLSNVISKAASAYGDVLINRENAKTASAIAKDNAKSQIDVMNAQLKAQAASTQNQFAQQQIALQQQQLFNASTGLGTGSISPTVLIVGGVALLTVLVFAMKK